MRKRKSRFNVYREGQVHVMSRLCDTCIYRTHSPIRQETREELQQGALGEETGIVCHSTLGTKQNALCRGYYEAAKSESQVLQLAERLGCLSYQQVEVKP